MAKRIYWETIKKFLIKHKISVTSLIVGLFIFLVAYNLIDIISHSGDMTCAGTEEDPCYAEITFLAKEDIFIYPIGYDPYGRETPFEFDKPLKDWQFYRSWGEEWRKIDLTKGCTGSWCGCSWCRKDKLAKYSYVFRTGRIYTIRVKAYKENPKDTIKWSFGDLDPIWYGTSGHEVIKNKVKWENEFGILEVYPHTCSDFTCIQYVNLTSKVDKNINLNFSFIFPEKIKGNIWFWQNYSHIVTVHEKKNCTNSVECLNIINSTMCEVEDEWDISNQTCDYIQDNICYHNYTCTPYHSEEKWFYDWKDKTHLMNHLKYQDKHYYYILNVPFKALETKQVKWEYESAIKKLPRGFGNELKWDLYIWREDYKNPSKYVKLDPWQYSDWDYRRNVSINNSQNTLTLKDYPVYINVTYDSDMNTSFQDLRFTYYNATDDTETVLNYCLADDCGTEYTKVDSTWTEVMVNVTKIRSSGYETVYMYYGNSTVTNTSDVDKVMYFEDFDVASLPSPWICVLGTCDISSNRLHLQDIGSGGGQHSITMANRSFPMHRKITFDFWWYDSGSGARDIYLYVNTSGGIHSMELMTTGAADTHRLYNSTTIKLLDGEMTGGQWYDITVKIYSIGSDRHNISYSIERTGETRYDFILDADPNYPNDEPVNKTGFGIECNLNPARDLYVDNVTIRQYEDPEPSYSVGSEETSVDTTKPYFSDNNTNTTVAGTPILHALKWTDETGLATTGGYIFSFDNCTGTLTNDTWAAFSSNPDWSNKTKTINSTVGCTIRWCFYANDTSDNWNGTSCVTPFSYVTTSDVVSTCANFDSTGLIDCKDNCVNSSVTVAGDLTIYSTAAGTVNLTDITIQGDLYENYTHSCYIYWYGYRNITGGS